MGLGKWFLKRGVVGMIAPNACTQYRKWAEALGTEATEEEVVEKMFWARYLRQKPFLTRKAFEILESCYYPLQYRPTDLLGFCLASLHIEGNVSKADGRLYDDCLEVIVEEMVKRGFSARRKGLVMGQVQECRDGKWQEYQDGEWTDSWDL